MTHRGDKPFWALGRPALLLLVTLGTGVVCSSAYAQPGYRFVDVDTATLVRAAAVNNNGVVAYWVGTGSSQKIYKWSNGVRALVADTFTGPFDSFGDGIEINDSGVVVFQAFLDDGSRGIFTSDGQTLTPVVTNATPNPLGGLFSGFGSSPTINSSGVVAFRGRTGATQGIFAASGGTVTPIVDDSGPLRDFGEPLSINDVGVVGFNAFFDGLPSIGGVFTKSKDGALTTIAQGVNARRVLTASSINNSGRLAFHEREDDDDGPNGIYSGTGGELQTLVERNERFAFEDDPSINDNGVIAYTYGGVGSQIRGIYTGPTIADKVIVDGDPLFESMVSADLTAPNKTYSHGLNEKGQIVFAYHLANGRNGVALATRIPEPDAAVMLSAGLALLLSQHSRRGSRALQFAKSVGIRNRGRAPRG